eukprot:jgi/Botrbrau1/17187/Bobra.0157s0078.2
MFLLVQPEEHAACLPNNYDMKAVHVTLGRCPRSLITTRHSVKLFHPASLVHTSRRFAITSAVPQEGESRPPAGPPGAFTEGEEASARQVLFNRIAPVYDQLNEALSLGQHRVWKKMTVKWSGASSGNTVLDICCGTGDLAFYLAEAVGPSGTVIGVDFAAEMLEDAETRRGERLSKLRMRKGRQWAQGGGAGERLLPTMQWVQGDALNLPLEDSQIDAATLGYGLRNVADIPRALQEARRVLKPGGRLAVLDFNNSDNPLIDDFQAWALERVVVPCAQSYGLGPEYEYLRPSIKAFPSGREQERLAKAAGFSKAVHYEIALGLMGVLVAEK